MAASRTRSLIHDQTQNTQFDGSALGAKATDLKAQKKVALGGKNSGTRTRKPLQDLNSRNNHGSIGSFDMGSSKANKPFVAQKNESVLKGGEKVTRKPLGDLTNSKKAQLKEASTATKENLCEKVLATKEEKVLPNDWISEEGFLHNHSECIKDPTRTMSMEYYLELLGLRKEPAPPAVKPELHAVSPNSLEVETSWEYKSEDEISLPEVPSPELSFSPPRSPLKDWVNVKFDLELKQSPPRNLNMTAGKS